MNAHVVQFFFYFVMLPHSWQEKTDPQLYADNVRKMIAR